MCAELATRANLLDAFGFGGFQALAGATGRGQNGRVALREITAKVQKFCRPQGRRYMVK
jgi:hypothetical protein